MNVRTLIVQKIIVRQTRARSESDLASSQGVGQLIKKDHEAVTPGKDSTKTEGNPRNKAL